MAQRRSNQIAELLRRELITFDVGDEHAVAADDSRVQGVVHQSLVRKRLLAEHRAHTANLSSTTGEEAPTGSRVS